MEPKPPPPLTLERIERAKPRAGCWFLTLPIFAVGAVFLGYGYLLWHGMQGRPAEGVHVILPLSTCGEAEAILLTLTGDEATDAALPEALSQPGAFEVRDQDGSLLASNGDLVDAGFRLDLLAQAHTYVHLKPEAQVRIRTHQEGMPKGSLSFFLDEVEIGTQRNLPAIEDAQLEIRPGTEVPDPDKMRAAVNRGIAIAHPLPCPVTLGQPVPVRAD